MVKLVLQYPGRASLSSCRLHLLIKKLYCHFLPPTWLQQWYMLLIHNMRIKQRARQLQRGTSMEQSIRRSKSDVAAADFMHSHKTLVLIAMQPRWALHLSFDKQAKTELWSANTHFVVFRWLKHPVLHTNVESSH